MHLNNSCFRFFVNKYFLKVWRKDRLGSLGFRCSLRHSCFRLLERELVSRRTIRSTTSEALKACQISSFRDSLRLPKDPVA